MIVFTGAVLSSRNVNLYRSVGEVGRELAQAKRQASGGGRLLLMARCRSKGVASGSLSVPSAAGLGGFGNVTGTEHQNDRAGCALVAGTRSYPAKRLPGTSVRFPEEPNRRLAGSVIIASFHRPVVAAFVHEMAPGAVILGCVFGYQMPLLRARQVTMMAIPQRVGPLRGDQQRHILVVVVTGCAFSQILVGKRNTAAESRVTTGHSQHTNG